MRFFYWFGGDYCVGGVWCFVDVGFIDGEGSVREFGVFVSVLDFCCFGFVVVSCDVVLVCICCFDFGLCEWGQMVFEELVGDCGVEVFCLWDVFFGVWVDDEWFVGVDVDEFLVVVFVDWLVYFDEFVIGEVDDVFGFEVVQYDFVVFFLQCDVDVFGDEVGEDWVQEEQSLQCVDDVFYCEYEVCCDEVG